MKVKIIDTQSELTALEEPWNELTARCDSPSLYSSYDYNRIAWKHLSNPKDRLFVLTLYDGAELKAIAPFCITRRKIRNIPIRIIEFIAAWEGDKPSITAPACEEAAWEGIYSFLSKEFLHWDVFKIMEQPDDSNLFTRGAFLQDKNYFCEISHDSTSYYIDLTKSWDSYLSTIDAKVKRNWRSRSKKIGELPEGILVETITQPGRIIEALDRFVALEKMSWKGKLAIGIHRDLASRHFYNEFTMFLAEKSQADIYFLKVGENDIAGVITYRYHDVVYERHVAYDPEFSKLSPGIYLRTCGFQNYFEKEFREYDMMGMHPNEGISTHKTDWASASRKTNHLLVYRKNYKLLPFLFGKNIKAYFKSLKTRYL